MHILQSISYLQMVRSISCIRFRNMVRKTQGICTNYIFRSILINDNRCQKKPSTNYSRLLHQELK